jgi:hypothetical protein
VRAASPFSGDRHFGRCTRTGRLPQPPTPTSMMLVKGSALKTL